MEGEMTRLILILCRSALAGCVLAGVWFDLAEAAPARVATNTNLRQGPGTAFSVILTVPAGGVVQVIRCGLEWCNVVWGGRPGYMIARNLMRGPIRVVRAAPPQVVVVDPPPVYYRPYYGPRFYGARSYYGPRPYLWRRW